MERSPTITVIQMEVELIYRLLYQKVSADELGALCNETSVMNLCSQRQSRQVHQKTTGHILMVIYLRSISH